MPLSAHALNTCLCAAGEKDPRFPTEEEFKAWLVSREFKFIKHPVSVQGMAAVSFLNTCHSTHACLTFPAITLRAPQFRHYCCLSTGLFTADICYGLAQVSVLLLVQPPMSTTKALIMAHHCWNKIRLPKTRVVHLKRVCVTAMAVMNQMHCKI